METTDECRPTPEPKHVLETRIEIWEALCRALLARPGESLREAAQRLLTSRYGSSLRPCAEKIVSGNGLLGDEAWRNLAEAFSMLPGRQP